MQIVLELKNPADLELLLPLLNRLQIAVLKKNEKKQPHNSKALASDSTLTTLPSLAEFRGESETGFDALERQIAVERNYDTIYVPQKKVEQWDFKKFYGSAKSNLSFDEIEQKLVELRKEWETNI